MSDVRESNVDEVGIPSWFDQNTPIHDATTTIGEVPPLSITEIPATTQLSSTLKEMSDQLDYLRSQMATVVDFLEKAGPLLDLAEKYTQGSKLDKARAAIGLRHG